ncbi:uncharacterized protein [Aegilops tauschii subsp. strangulata]|uniref:uncharacterized protein n=1 Tax=Aegilops tauschii subsp. strangulata TaxID=200361 RepID=UPI000989F357
MTCAAANLGEDVGLSKIDIAGKETPRQTLAKSEIVLEFKSAVFPKWRTFFNITVATYALEDHLTTETPSTDPTWLRLDVLVLRWLYGSMAMDIVDLVMPTDPATATAYKVWTSVLALFNDNKKSREIYLAEEFHNIKQEDRSITEYLHLQKTAADALAEVGAPVSDPELVTNVIKGLHERFDSVADIAPLLMPFPTFLNFRNMLLLHEMKASRRSNNTSVAAFYAAKGPALAPPSGGGASSGGGGGAPSGAGGGQPWRAPAPAHNPHATGYGKGKGKNKGYKSAGGASPMPTPFNPWTGAIQMWPMQSRPNSTGGILGRGSGSHADAYMAAPPAAPGAPYGGYGSAPYGAVLPYAAPPTPAPSWDTAALAQHFTNMTLQQPAPEWVMDSSATAHLSSDAGPSFPARDPSVQ